MMPMLCSPLLATSSQPDAARALPCNAIAHSTNERLRNAVSRCFIGAVSYHQDFKMCGMAYGRHLDSGKAKASSKPHYLISSPSMAHRA